MNIYETFYNLRNHHKNEVVELFAMRIRKAEHKKVENSFDFDDMGYLFMTD